MAERGRALHTAGPARQPWPPRRGHATRPVVDTDLDQAIARLEAAVARAEAAAARPDPALARLRARHERLRAQAAEAVAALDRLIESSE